jgi:high-affinity iron transporter
MLPSFLLSLREGLEASLIIGIVLGALRKLRRPDLVPTVWLGVICASVLSILAAVMLIAIGFELEGTAEEIFEGVTMFIAAGVLTWMIFWMNSQSRHIKGELESGVTRAVTTSDRRGLFWLSFVAVAREGVELALFLAATVFVVVGREGSLGSLALIGAVLGLGTAALLGWSLFASTVRLDLRRFFRVTGLLLLIFAAGLVAHGVHEFVEAGFLPALIDPIWNLGAIIPESSLFGQVLGTLFGYSSDPSLVEMVAYFGYLAGVLIALRVSNRRADQATKAAVQAQA